MSADLATLTAAQLIERSVQLSALSKLIDAQQAELRPALEAAVLALETQAGQPGMTLKHPTGTAYITVPSKRVEVSDPSTYEAWARQAHPEMVVEQAVYDVLTIAQMADSDPDFQQKLVDAGAIRNHVTVLLDDVVLTLPTTELGAVVDPATGEMIGAHLRDRSRRALTVSPSKEAIARIQSGLTERVGLLLGEGS